MDKKYIQPFIDATLNVMEDFFNVIPELQNPYLIKREENFEWDLSAVIGIAGETRGVVVISFSKAMAAELTSALVGQQAHENEDDIIDTIGEVVNIIAGNAKKGLEEYRLVISLPSIVEGPQHKIQWPGSNIPIVGIPFLINGRKFHLSVGLENIIKG